MLPTTRLEAYRF